MRTRCRLWLARWLSLALALPAALGVSALVPGRAHADAFSAELTLLTTHVQTQRDAPVKYYPRKLDSRGQNTLTPGVKLSYEVDLAKPLWGAGQAGVTWGELSDSVEHRFGFLAALARWELWRGERVSWSLRLGAGLIYRQSWRDIPGYTADNPLHESRHFLRGYEWAVLPLGDVSLLYRFTPRLEGVWSIVPGIPYVVLQSLGARWSF
jgi:hypothetical protein